MEKHAQRDQNADQLKPLENLKYRRGDQNECKLHHEKQKHNECFAEQFLKQFLKQLHFVLVPFLPNRIKIIFCIS